MPNVIPSPIPFATATAPGIVSTAAQDLGAGVKTFAANVTLGSGALLTGTAFTFGAGGFYGANPAWVTTNTTKFVIQNGTPISGFAGVDVRATHAVQIASALGTGSTESCVKVGTTQALGSVHANARLLSVRTGLTATEFEPFWITKNGPNMTSTQAFEMNGDGGGVKLQYRTSDGMAGIHNGAAAWLGMFPGTGSSGCSGNFAVGGALTTTTNATVGGTLYVTGNIIGDSGGTPRVRFLGGSPTLELLGVGGTNASDVLSKIGTSTADGSVNSSAKLLSLRTGIGGTEVEYLSIAKNTVTFPSANQTIIKFDSGGANRWEVRAQPNVSFSIGNNTVNYLQLRLTDGCIATDFGFAASNGSGSADYFKVVAGIGRVDQWGTDSSGSPGAATINKPTGISAIASGASSVVITNSQATATSRVMVTWLGDHGAARWWVTRAAGSFTVNLSAAASANTAFAWEVSSLL